MTGWPWGVVFLATLLAASASRAEGDEDGPIDFGAFKEPTELAFEQASGFIVDRTVTNFGAEFARGFADAWRAQGGVEGVDLAIVEKPSARWGSTVYVEQNNRALVRTMLYAGRSADIRPLAQRTAQYLQRQVADMALLKSLTRDDDLGKEELP